MRKITTNIIERNRDVEHIMHASCQYGWHAGGEKNSHKLFATLVTTDVHGCGKQFDAAIEYLNYYDALDCGICLGDMQPGNFAEENAWYVEGVKKSKKPFLTVLGNHDLGNSTKTEISSTPQMAFERFFQPVLEKIGVHNLEKPYYLRFFEKYKIAILALNLYDTPNDKAENGDYVLHRGYEAFSQEQVDFIIDALNRVPRDYHLMISMHSFPYSAKPVECDWSQNWKQLFDDIESDKAHYYKGDLLPDIIHAWENGASLKAKYSPKAQGVLPTLTVDCDFSARGKGAFVGYFVGHYHCDCIAHSAKYKNQNVVCFPATAMDTWQNYGTDLARAEGTKAEDLLTVVSIHTEKREIRLVRIGSNFTMNMKERMYYTLAY